MMCALSKHNHRHITRKHSDAEKNVYTQMQRDRRGRKHTWEDIQSLHGLHVPQALILRDLSASHLPVQVQEVCRHFVVFCANSAVLYAVQYQHNLCSYGSVFVSMHVLTLFFSTSPVKRVQQGTLQQCVCKCSVKNVCPLLHLITEMPAFMFV